MKKLILLLCIIPGFVACDLQVENTSTEPWLEDDKRMFIDECINRSTGVKDFDVEEYCQCMQGRIEENYRVDELGQINMIEMSRFAEACIDEQEGHDHHH